MKLTQHKITVLSYEERLGNPEWRIHCSCGWKEKALTDRDALSRFDNHSVKGQRGRRYDAT